MCNPYVPNLPREEALGQFNLANLRTIILEVVNSQNPNAIHPNAVDQIIDEQHLGNLGDLDKLPDVVKCLREFSGKPGEFNSWKKSMERILNFKGTPKYYGILNIIRNNRLDSNLKMPDPTLRGQERRIDFRIPNDGTHRRKLDSARILPGRELASVTHFK